MRKLESCLSFLEFYSKTPRKAAHTFLEHCAFFLENSFTSFSERKLMFPETTIPFITSKNKKERKEREALANNMAKFFL